MEEEIPAIYHKIGTIIKKMRVDEDISQFKLCHLSNISLTALQSLEYGTKKIQIDTLKKICTALDIQLSDLFRQIRE